MPATQHDRVTRDGRSESLQDSFWDLVINVADEQALLDLSGLLVAIEQEKGVDLLELM